MLPASMTLGASSPSTFASAFSFSDHFTARRVL
jgi:hypothetical protein